MKGIKGRFLSKYRALPTMASLKQSLLPQLHIPTKLHESFDNILSVPEINFYKPNNAPEVPKDVQEETLTSPKGKHRSPVSVPVSDQAQFLEEFQELPSGKNKSLEINRNFNFNLDEETQKEEALSSPKEKHQSPVSVPVSDQVQFLEEFQKLKNSGENCNFNFDEGAEKEEEFPELEEFEEKCPPGGREAVILYTTSMRGINKTFEDCKRIRFLLESFHVVYHERDVSLHMDYRDELWDILGGRVVPPRLFINGRLIGGADEVVGLHERGDLRKLLKGIPLVNPCVSPCNGCSGMRFVLCLNCHGSCKITADEKMIRCPDCNENGLIKCPLCN